MRIAPPSGEDLQKLAAGHHLRLSEEELEAVSLIASSMVGALSRLDESEPDLELEARLGRLVGERPSETEDPCNAIVRRCSVKGAPGGRLAGKRIGVKDTIGVAGVPLTCGSKLLEGFVPERDATVVRRVLDEGAEIVAILNMDDMAVSASGDSSAYGPVRNPHDHDLLAGGSSGGSAAALFYDEIDLSIGGDQGGSIRIPSSWCGTVGLKPTHGLVPYTGAIGADATIDHLGPMTRSVADAALLLEVLAGKDPDDPRQEVVPTQVYTAALGREIRDLRIGLVEEGFRFEGMDPEVARIARAAAESLEGLGARVVELSVPAHRQAEGLLAPLLCEGFESLIASNGIGYQLRGRQDMRLAAALGEGRRERASQLSLMAKTLLVCGSYLKQQAHGRAYAWAQNARPGLRAAYDRAFQQVDILVMPTTPTVAPRYQPDLSALERLSANRHVTANTAAFDLSGHPSLSLPCGRLRGLPVGLMLTGRHFEESKLLRVAQALESALEGAG
jgi:amidase